MISLEYPLIINGGIRVSVLHDPDRDTYLVTGTMTNVFCWIVATLDFLPDVVEHDRNATAHVPPELGRDLIARHSTYVIREGAA